MQENYGIVIPYIKTFLDMQNYLKSGRVHIILCFACIHFTYKTYHERKNLKIPSNLGKFPWQLLYIGLLPSYHI